MRLYHFVNSQFGIKDLREKRLKISRLNRVNDPFEFFSVELSNRENRRRVKALKERLSATRGLICFSAGWQNPVQWSHYADHHRGICLGFDIPESIARKVDYVHTRFRWPETIDEEMMVKLLFTKFAHWSYEDEYRIYTTLEDPDENGLHYMDFSDSLRLRDVIVGMDSPLRRAEIVTALSGVSGDISIFKARAAFRSYRVVRNLDEGLWR